MKDRIIYAEATDKQAAETARFLKGLNVEVEAGPALKSGGNGATDGHCSIFIVPFRGGRSDHAAAIKSLKNGPVPPSIIIITTPEAATSEKLISLVSHDLVDQVVFEGNSAGLRAAVKSELERRRLTGDLESLRRRFRLMKQRRTLEAKRFFALEGTFDATLENFMTALDLRDVETFGHSKTVARYSLMLAEACGIGDRASLDDIRKGALLHDIGKIAVPDAILNKPNTLNEEEWRIVRRHPEIGFGLVKNVGMVREIGNIILHHHERFDGSGYPEGLKAEDIPLEARIFSVADTLDAITSPRPYREARDFTAAGEEIAGYSGTQFDPEIVKAFQKHPAHVWERVRYETTRFIPGFEGYIGRGSDK